MFFIEERWSNWAGTFTTPKAMIYEPASIEEVSILIKQVTQKQQTIRAMGARHSFSGVAKPDDVGVSLTRMRGLIQLDKLKQEATFWAGTHLYEIGPLLEEHGYGLANMGDIDMQSLAGATSTGTHGTGITLGSLSSQVTRWGLVDGEGNYREVTREDPLAQSLHIGLGLFGIVVQITIKVVPVYGLAYESSRITVQDTLAQFQSIIETNRHAEWYYFPGQSQMQLKVMNAVPYEQLERQPTKPFDNFIENQVLQGMSSLCKRMPQTTSLVSKISAKAVPIGARQDVSYRIFASPRQVKFAECEYAMPLHYFEAFLEELHFTMSRELFHVHFPIECRTQKGEAGILSPTQQQDSAFFAFHMYKGMPYKRYFRYMDHLLQKYGGRAHFGKMNRYTRCELKKQYSDIDIFLTHQQQCDPNSVFMTEYMRKILI